MVPPRSMRLRVDNALLPCRGTLREITEEELRMCNVLVSSVVLINYSNSSVKSRGSYNRIITHTCSNTSMSSEPLSPFTQATSS